SAKLREGKIDFWNYPKFEIMPALRKFYGGILIDANCKTEVPGLFAAGESTTGSQGARRLDGDGISGALVFGSRAAKSAVDYVSTMNKNDNKTETATLTQRSREISEKMPRQGIRGKSSVGELKMELRNVMWENLGIVRDREKMLHALAQIRDIRRVSQSECTIEKTEDLVGWLEIQNMLLVSEMVAGAALIREESRGFHFRKDFPSQDDRAWRKWILTSKSDHATTLDEEISFEVCDVPSGSRFSEVMKQLASEEQIRKESTMIKPAGFEMVGD
ncbi:MAG: FAD-binding protein, partial [Thaumarchaeota archaeon]|nr:FAD-binding protein [Nitrososphaerota archaeon]